MHLIQSSNLTMLALTMLAAAVGFVLVLMRARVARDAPTRDERLLNRFGFVALVVLALGFLPLNVVNHLLADQFAWIFGSETYDGGVIETLTVAFYCATIAALTMHLARRSDGDPTGPAWRVVFALGLFSLVFLTGEELSWGQHMLGFATPDAVAATNLQGEANVHNLVSPRLYDSIYQVIGFILILAPALSLWPASLRLLGPFAKGASLAFNWPFLYPLFALTGFLLQHEVFEELAELSLAATLFGFFAAFYAVESRRSEGGVGIANRQAIMTKSVHSPS